MNEWLDIRKLQVRLFVEKQQANQAGRKVDKLVAKLEKENERLARLKIQYEKEFGRTFLDDDLNKH